MTTEQVKPQINWRNAMGNSDHIKGATLSHTKFDVRVAVEWDHDHDWTLGRGKFFDTFQLGAVACPNDVYNQTGKRSFVPDVLAQERCAAFIEQGKSPEEAEKLARAEVMRDLRIAADPDALGYYAVGVIVKVWLEGVELGYDACWGIETSVHETQDAHIDEVAWECAAEAVSAAEKKLEALKKH